MYYSLLCTEWQHVQYVHRYGLTVVTNAKKKNILKRLFYVPADLTAKNTN